MTRVSGCETSTCQVTVVRAVRTSFILSSTLTLMDADTDVQMDVVDPAPQKSDLVSTHIMGN